MDEEGTEFRGRTFPFLLSTGGLDTMTRWIRALKSRSFRLKLMITSVACILIPTCITLGVSNVMTEKAMKEQAAQNARNTLQLVDGYVSSLLDLMLYVINYIQVDAEVNVVLREQAAEPLEEDAEFRYRRFVDEYYTVIKKLDNLSIAGGEQFFITILLPNGKSYTNYAKDELDPDRWRDEPWFEELRKLSGFDTYWVGTQPTMFRTLKKDHPHQLSIARPLRNNSRIYAYVIVTVLEDNISYIFQQSAGGREIALIDGTGRIHSHTDPAKIGTVLDEAALKTSGFIRLDGEAVLAVREELRYADWSLLLLSPYKEAIAGVRNMNKAVFLNLLVSFFTFMLLLILLIGTFTKPLKRLGRLAETVQRGNLQVRSHIRGQDEIGYLGSSFDQMLDRINEMIAEITAEQTKKRKAELAMLQAQINPHFLFNVLNSIRLNILRKGDRENAEVISSLSRLLRMTIEQDKENISLRDEMELVSHYVRLMNMRRKEKAQFVLDIPEEALTVRVPRFFLQPVIENALIHGLKQRGGTIRVGVRFEPETMVIAVEDDGIGMDRETLEKLRRSAASSGERTRESDNRQNFSGIGLSNVRERLRFIYGEHSAMRIDSAEGRGTAVTFLIPRQEVNAAHVQSDAG